MKKHLKGIGFVAGLVFAIAPLASAVPQIKLTAGAITKTIIDNGVGDFDPTPGIILFSGGVGTKWSGTVEVGRSKPDLGSASHPSMDLSINALSRGTSVPVLKIQFTDTGFTGMDASGVTADAAIGGTTQGKVTYKTYIDYANTPFGGTLLTSQTFTPVSGGSFSGDLAAVASGGIPYSLTLEWDITHPNGTKLTTGDSSLRLQVPDGGMTLALLGSSLVGLAAIRRKF